MKKLRYSILNPLIFVIILWQIKIYELSNNTSFASWGIFPREVFGLKGVLLWGFIHGNVEHLLSNTVPLLVLGTMIYYFYPKLATRVVLVSYIATGIAVWLFGNPDGGTSYHIGSSGIVYSIFGFLFFSGWLRKDKASIAISLIITIFYGGMVWGVLPLQKGVSWEGHLFGLFSGLVLAFYYRKTYVPKEHNSTPTPDYRQVSTNIIYKPTKLSQSTSFVVMVRPNNFGYNEQTAGTNVFQHTHELLYDKNLNQFARNEFDGLANALANAGVHVLVFEDQVHKTLPDAIFPNNWITMHHDGTVIYYPMLAKNRREERREDIIDLLIHKYGFNKTEVLDLSSNEKEGIFLEGTGSIVFDHVYKLAFANISSRTHQQTFFSLCHKLGYQPVIFNARNSQGEEIYHTNVMLSIGSRFAVICLECIPDLSEREMVKQTLAKTGKTIISISEGQMNNFCGNILELQNNRGAPVIVMSDRAWENFDAEQQHTLNQFGHVVHSDLKTIENFGGGSARCMLAELFLPGA